MKKINGDDGQVMILTALGLVVLLSAVGLAVDVGTLYRARRVVQAASDAAALAGAYELPFGDMTTAARADASLNGVTHGVGATTVAVNNPPLSGPHAGNSGYVEVISSTSQSLFFLNVLNSSSATVNARAVAGRSHGQNCVYTMNPTGIGFKMTGTSNLSMPTCGVIDDSSDNSQALDMVASSTIVAKSIGVVGAFNRTGSGTTTPAPITGIVAASDPLGFLTAPTFLSSSCLPDPNVTGGTVTLGPSGGGTICYNKLSISGSGSVTFNSGTYIMNGPFTVTGSVSISGTGGVTFYLSPIGSFSESGSGLITLTAPTTGTYNGILIFQDRSNTSTVSINGSGTQNIKGIVYAPTGSLVINGSGGSTFSTSLVVGSFVFTGSGTLGDYYAVNPGTPLKSAVLAE